MAKTPDQIAEELGAARIVESGAELVVPKKADRKINSADDAVRGWSKIEIGGGSRRFSDRMTQKAVRRALLRAVDPGLNLNAARPKKVRKALDTLEKKIFKASFEAAAAKAERLGPEIHKKFDSILTKREEKERREKYKSGCETLRSLFRGLLSDMEEDELLEIFRGARVEGVMTA